VTFLQGNDAGSTYYPAKCAKCKTQLGKVRKSGCILRHVLLFKSLSGLPQVYKCTPSHLDDHRDCFTLDVSRFLPDCILSGTLLFCHIPPVFVRYFPSSQAESLCIYHLDDGPADTVAPNQFGGAQSFRFLCAACLG
jgi:hypothetical protein